MKGKRREMPASRWIWTDERSYSDHDLSVVQLFLAELDYVGLFLSCDGIDYVLWYNEKQELYIHMYSAEFLPNE